MCELFACEGDPKSVEGALSRAASAVASRDHEALFASLDERSRFALAATFKARQRAAQLIAEDYPAALREQALRDLGDAARAGSEAELFRSRCDDACVQAFAAKLGAPVATHVEGRLATVKTARGTTVQLYRGEQGRYGLVWETEALARERTRSAAELDLIQKNAAQYRAQRALE